MSDRKPFHEKEYTKENERFYPFLEVKCCCKNLEEDISALADTGCDTGIALSKEHVESVDLGEKTNIEPIEISVADGHVLGADVYEATAEIEGERRDVELCILDPTKIIRFEPASLCPVIGRNLLDKFDVLFKGEERKIVLLK